MTVRESKVVAAAERRDDAAQSKFHTGLPYLARDLLSGRR